MKPREQINEIPIPTETFIKNVQEKIREYKKDNWDTIFSFSPYLEFDNVRLKGNTLIIDKSMKLLDKGSPYRGISGTIESEIIKDGDKTILKAKIYLDTALQTVLRFTVGGAFLFAGIPWLILDFNFKVLLTLLIVQGFIFGITPLIQNDGLNTLNRYYDHMIKALIKK